MSVLEPSLDNCQFGCRKHQSTVHALTAILHTWMSSLDSGDSVRTVFVDFRKAFDLVNHNILFSKLIKHNVPHFLLRWFGSYLTGRQQRVRTSQSLSFWKELKGGMPQGSWLGPLSFLVLINDLSTGCPVHKYVDDTTLTELLPKHAKTEMSTFLSNLLSWANENDMEINTTKTKEMILGPLARSNLPFLSTPTGTIERVTSFKLLGLQIDASLSWANHTTIIIQKASRRLYFLKQLKRAGLATHHLLDFYIAVIRPVLEYCAPVWHYALTKAQTQELEAIQKRAIHIIFHFTRGMPYSYMLDATNLSSLSSRRDDLSRNFFLSITKPASCLHHLLPPPRSNAVTSRLRSYEIYPRPSTRTKRYCSLVQYGLSHYQKRTANS